MSRPSTSDSDWIPMADVEMNGGPRESTSLDEELDTLLVYQEPKKPKWGSGIMRSPRLGALYQVCAFLVVGLVILVASGLLAFYTLHNDKAPEPVDFVHAPLPDMKNPGLLKFLGGMGPYIGGEYTPIPHSCEVTQVHMISRHGERYPTSGMGVHIEEFASNIAKAPELNWNSQLGFLNEWTLATDGFMVSPEEQWDQETLTGPAAGSVRMFTLGNEFRTRYSELWGWGDERVKVWASDMTRVIDSAKYFAQGFFGINADVEYEIIPETADQWGDTLTPAYVVPAED
jgi:Histidine phosphatase superfamily (branch 2)